METQTRGEGNPRVTHSPAPLILLKHGANRYRKTRHTAPLVPAEVCLRYLKSDALTAHNQRSQHLGVGSRFSQNAASLPTNGDGCLTIEQRYSINANHYLTHLR